jgi:uncharacterized protein YbcI
MVKLSRGQVEAALANALIQFEKDHLGRGPTEARAFVIEDMILVRLRGVLTQVEIKLAQNPDGPSLIKQMRQQLLEGGRPALDEIVQRITGSQPVSLHTDISVKTGERVIVFTMAENLDERFDWLRQDRGRSDGPKI